MRRTELQRTSGLKRGRRKVRSREQAQAFREAAKAQRVCAVTGSNRWPWDAHHVIEAAWLRTWAPEHVYDTRNALRLVRSVHDAHTTATMRVPLSALLDENIEFAFTVMGAFAYDYLTRRYGGYDERVELALAEAEHAAA